MSTKIRFGTAGNPESFYEKGGKSSLEMPKWLSDMGLSAYEYQCGRGVKISSESAKALRKEAKKHGVSLSVHSPYYINISSDDDAKIESSMNYIMQSARAAANMGAKRIVLHMGSAGKMTRRAAMEISKRTVLRALSEMDNEGLGDISLCPETMGKINRMGTLDEVLELCRLDERLIPTIDFGHLNSRGLGNLVTVEDFREVTARIKKVLGGYRAKNFHTHFSKIEFTSAGEKRHLTFAATEYGPEFGPFAKVLVEDGLTPVIICESAGTQAEDAAEMKRIYEEALKNADNGDKRTES
ncbi:MAG: putative endonuclease 4 [Firmicutes bacterium ADurb.Bin193]|nr:MAG: putative endonuclease 4 [Firmicutes bacterium ADurb.Bin193]